jgi:putative transposase
MREMVKTLASWENIRNDRLFADSGQCHRGSFRVRWPAAMADYRRYFVPGGTYFFTLVTHRRRKLFVDKHRVAWLRTALREVRTLMPFTVQAAVILPDHMHFMWSLPAGDDQYSKRIGLMKVRFTKLLRASGDQHALRKPISRSRQVHRESNVWQRRFWEHTIEDDDEFDAYFDYIHYNPVKHGYVSCPHQWQASSFRRWVRLGVYEFGWGCQCNGRPPSALRFLSVEATAGEP